MVPSVLMEKVSTNCSSDFLLVRFREDHGVMSRQHRLVLLKKRLNAVTGIDRQ
jgi:hypothetical protein